MRFHAALILALAVPGNAAAQSSTDRPPPGITVVGTATIETAPDMATISITIRGEGATPDAASRELATRQRAISGGLAGLDAKLRFRTGSVATSEVRKGDCAQTPGDVDISAMVRMGNDSDADKGPCRITGYIAAIEATAELSSIDAAGTAVGLAQRQGAASAQIQMFGLHDSAAPTRSAAAAAMADARAQAQALATAAGARLGPVVSVMGAPYGESRAGLAAPAEVALYTADFNVAQPVAIAVTPKPVETTARIVVVYALTD